MTNQKGFCPPIGQIDGSVLSAVGMLLMFATVGKLPEAIKEGRSLKFQTDKFTAEVLSKPNAE